MDDELKADLSALVEKVCAAFMKGDDWRGRSSEPEDAFDRVLTALEDGGLVVVPRGSLECLFEVHLRDADSAAPMVLLGAYPQVPYSQQTYVDAWLSLHAAAIRQRAQER